MAAGDFTDATLPDILVEVDSIFPSGRTNKEAEFYFPGTSAKQFLEKGSAQTNEILEGGICKGVTAFFIEGGTDTVTHDGSAEDGGYSCTPATGTQMQTEGVTYDNNLYIRANYSVADPKCDNATAFVQESAKAFLRCRKDILKRLNQRTLNLWDSNVQANQATTSTVTNASALGGNRLRHDISGWTNDFLVELDLLTYENSIFDQLIVNVGRNFWTAERLATYRKFDDDKRNENEIYQDFDIHWDLEGYSQLGSRNSTFLLNPNNFLFWTTTWSDATPTLVDPSTNKWTFTMNDPELMYNRNGVMTPVTYEVRYTYSCTGVTTYGQEIYTHNWEVSLRGGQALAPAGFAPLHTGSDVHAITGILEVVAEDAP